MGDAQERMLVNFLEDEGWGAMRAGASGRGSTADRPDVIAGDGGVRYWALEEKYAGSSKQIYEDPEKRKSLSTFSTRFGARPMWAVRFSTNLAGVEHADWRIAPMSEPPETDSGKVKLHHSIVEEWPLLADII